MVKKIHMGGRKLKDVLPELKDMVKERLLEKSGPNIRLTHNGLMIANCVYREFL